MLSVSQPPLPVFWRERVPGSLMPLMTVPAKWIALARAAALWLRLSHTRTPAIPFSCALYCFKKTNKQKTLQKVTFTFNCFCTEHWLFSILSSSSSFCKTCQIFLRSARRLISRLLERRRVTSFSFFQSLTLMDLFVSRGLSGLKVALCLPLSFFLLLYCVVGQGCRWLNCTV